MCVCGFCFYFGGGPPSSSSLDQIDHIGLDLPKGSMPDIITSAALDQSISPGNFVTSCQIILCIATSLDVCFTLNCSN